MDETRGGAETRRVVADRGDAGQRLDLVLLRRLADVPGLSRTRVQRWIEEGRVRVGGRRPSKASARVALGRRDPRRPAACRDLAAFRAASPRTWSCCTRTAPSSSWTNRPALSRTLPTSTPAGHCSTRCCGAASTTRHRGRRASCTGSTATPLGCCSRRRPTRPIGCMSTAWRTPDVQKTYLAIVWGRPPRRRGEIRLRLDRDPVDRRSVLASRGARTREPHALRAGGGLARNPGGPVVAGLQAGDRADAPDPRAPRGHRLAHRRATPSTDRRACLPSVDTRLAAAGQGIAPAGTARLAIARPASGWHDDDRRQRPAAGRHARTARRRRDRCGRGTGAGRPGRATLKAPPTHGDPAGRRAGVRQVPSR